MTAERTHTSQKAIHIHDVTKRYRSAGLLARPALAHVSLDIPQGEVFGFLGPNGAGKTTLIKLIVGVMKPDRGQCRLMGKPSHSREAKLKLGYLPERPYYHEFLTAEEFLRFHGKLLGMPISEIDGRTDELLEKLDLGRARHQKLRTFSKGMLQRIGFAQALLHDPQVLVLDEPMSGLDPVGRREVRDIITSIANTGKTIFFSTHIVHDVEVICTTVGFIHEGKLKGSGNIQSLLGKTLESMEIRFTIPGSRDLTKSKWLSRAMRTMDGWAVEVESPAERLETEVNHVLKEILEAKGVIRAVVPRKSNLEDLFFKGSK